MIPDYAQLNDLLHQPLWAYYVSVAFAIVPVIRIFARTGMKPWPAALLAAPYVGILLCAAVLVFQKWPRLARGAR